MASRLTLLLAAGAAASLTLAACNGAAEPPFLAEISPLPSPTATSAPAPTGVLETPTPEGECDGMGCFRAFAAEIERALKAGDASFFASRAIEEERTCTGDPQIPAYDSCFEEPAGTVLRGIPILEYTRKIVLLSRDDYAASLERWFAEARADLSDEFGTGAVALHALATFAHSQADRQYVAMVSGIFEGRLPPRESRLLSFELIDGEWRLDQDEVAVWLPSEEHKFCDPVFDYCERWEGSAP